MPGAYVSKGVVHAPGFVARRAIESCHASWPVILVLSIFLPWLAMPSANFYWKYHDYGARVVRSWTELSSTCSIPSGYADGDGNLEYMSTSCWVGLLEFQYRDGDQAAACPPYYPGVNSLVSQSIAQQALNKTWPLGTVQLLHVPNWDHTRCCYNTAAHTCGDDALVWGLLFGCCMAFACIMTYFLYDSKPALAGVH